MDYFQFKMDETIRFNSAHTTNKNNWKPRVKLLADFDLILAFNSRVNILCNSEKHVIEANEAFLAHPGQTIYINPDVENPAEVAVLHFMPHSYSKTPLAEVRERLLESRRNSPQFNNIIFLANRIKIRNEYVQDILKVILEETKYQRYGFEQKVIICLFDLLFELHRSCAEDIIFGNIKNYYSISNKYAKQIINYLYNNYMHPIFSRDIENMLGYSYDYLNATFKRVTGFSIMSYLDSIRITRAKELMDTTTLNLYEIASLVGIKDPHYFSKKYKNLEGISPSSYKKQC